MQWYKRQCCFCKILKDQSPKYIFNIIPNLTRPFSTRNTNNIPHFKVKHSFFKNTFFHESLLDGINGTLKFKMLLALIFSKRIFQSLKDLPQS